MRRTFLIFLLVLIAAAPSQAQIKTVAEYIEQVRTLSTRADVKAADDYIDKNHDNILREWIAITEINAPSSHEQERAKYIEKLLRSYHLDDVHYDSVGNLIAVRKGSSGGPMIVFDAHMDTVFQPGLQIKATIRDGKVYAPGIGDDTRNVEALLATIRALNEAHVKTKGDLVFVFTVEEETTFKGVTNFVNQNKGKIDQYVALDGGYEGFTYAGIGINWYRHHFVGPGGHTRSRTPPYSATLPLARAIERIYQLTVPTNPSSNLNIGMLGGSEVVNAKAADAWFTVDLRSTSNEVLADLESKIKTILDEEAAREHMSVKTDVISKTPAASIPGHRESYLVRMSEAVHRVMGFDPPITNAGSNNGNVALLAGISAISTGAGPCDGSHSLAENCEIEPFYNGIRKVMLLEVALAGVQ
ncbi:MAG TPA: M20/M25/M40 family metallo-hydrolase [Pyrinomonadaceae bacterium]|jgi:acetylornithine deacetylase/succinyl-diaminopimelate desuccinylase-like protein|nr:M20/M25/M40 family metallo-hydrolase [Pyrinomonadaceae bacterium]